MQIDRAWIFNLCTCILAILSFWQGQALAEQNYPSAGYPTTSYPSTGYEAGFVHYQITPLPPITDVGFIGEIPVPLNPEAGDASTNDASPEEVQPLEDDGVAKAGESAVDEEGKQDEIESDLEIVPEEPEWWCFWEMWDISYELGVNGSVGNSNTHTWRTAVRSKRATDTSVLTGSLDYKKSMENSVTTADRLFGEWRAEFPMPELKWSWYLHGTVEFDEFRAYNSRVAEDSGIGYQWYKDDVGSFITRVGAGTSREFGGPNDEWIPEGVIGAVCERKITKRQKISLSNEFFYDMTNFNENRMNSKADWEVVLDDVAHLSLKVGIINRYDSTPDGKKPNDVDYSTVFLWAF